MTSWSISAALAEPPDSGPPAIPTLTVPRISSPPTLDGLIDPDEWREAVAVSGVIGASPGSPRSIHPRPTTYYLAWDDEHVYLAARTWVAPHIKPHVRGREPGGALTHDPGTEMHFRPMGGNVSETANRESYKFSVNMMGYDGDLRRVSVGQQFRNWYPDFEIATHTTEPGTAPDGGRWWQMEMAISYDDLDLAGPHQAGDAWRMMLGFNQLAGGGWMQARIPSTSGYFDPSGFCYVTLADDVPAVQMTMDAIPGFAEERAAANIQVHNPTDLHRRVQVLAHVFTDEAEVVKLLENLELAPKQTRMLAFDEPFTVEEGMVHFRVVEDDEIIFDYGAQVARWEQDEVDTMLYRHAQERKVTFASDVALHPISGIVRLEADAYPLDDPEAVEHVDYRIMREADDEVLESGRIAEARNHYFTKVTQLENPLPGTYRVELTMTLADGTTLGPQRSRHEKLDEATEFPEWWDTGRASAERVISPFEPIKRDGNIVSVWGRTYHVNALGLPVQIVSQGGALLRSPVRMVAVINGEAHTIEVDAAPRFDEALDWRHSFQGTARGAGLRFDAEGWIEQDGLAYIELTYAPEDSAPIVIEALRIEYPLAPEQAEGVMTTATGGNYSPLTTRSLTGREGKVWDTLEPGRCASGMTVGSFYPLLWMGSDRRGLLWWADSDQGWVPDNDVPAHEVLVEAGEAVMRNNIIGTPFELTAPRTIRLSYMASPFRPLVKGWRQSIWSENHTFSGPHKQRNDPETGERINGWNWLSPPSRDPAEWGDLWASYKPMAEQRIADLRHHNPARARSGYHPTRGVVHTSLPLFGYGARSPDTRVNDYFSADWRDNPLNKSQRDYWLYLLDRAFGEGGLKTIYWDVFNARALTNLASAAYVLPDGRVQPGYVGWNGRRFMMRQYGLMHDHGLAPGAAHSHATNCYLLVAAAWVDGILDGEWHSIGDNAQTDWVDGYPIERMRFKSSPHNWGVAISWMDHIRVEDQERRATLRRGMRDYVFLYDSWRNPSTGWDMPDAMLTFGLNDHRIAYHPFWRNPYVQADNDDVLVSLWTMPGRSILGVFNHDRDRTTDVRLELDLEELGLTGGRVDAHVLLGEDEHAFDPSGRLYVRDLAPHTGRYYGIRVVDRDALAAFRTQYAKLLASTDAQADAARPSVPPGVLDHDLIGPDTVHRAPDMFDHVATDAPDIELWVWQRPDRVLLGVVNRADHRQAATLEIDLDAMDLVPELPWQEFVRAHNLTDGRELALDFHDRKLLLPALDVNQALLVVVRRY